MHIQIFVNKQLLNRLSVYIFGRLCFFMCVCLYLFKYVNYQQCGGVLSASSGFIKSRVGEDCEWNIVGTTGSYISLDILELECECKARTNCSNGLLIYDEQDNAYATQRICKDFHSHIMLPASSMFIWGNNIKLRAKYSTIQNSCGGTLNSLRGTIASPLYPEAYPANIECIWEIRTVGSTYELNLAELDIRKSDECNEDFLEIRNGETGRLKGLYCGNEVSEDILTLFENVWIKFRSVARGIGKGFKLAWNLAHATELNNLTSGIIVSPPLYDIGEEELPYTWRIFANRGERIQLHFKE